MKYNKLTKSILKRIDSLRKEKDLSWGKLAYAADISKSTMSDIKNGASDARFSTLCKLAIGLNMHPKELFDFDIDLSELDE